ncbi:hypothetical protein GH5_01474 [Leishmania sp. Ghana 2012 LV757]|uniref:hypothetical protein n=1 Tax=Leishmania sp. Ghana 2012 LV757 TaxID=2803181 RepID=UPI001B530981|nr:hypothetical protein GH5_01474 [Leishmania sp. Ghana 2012 LV757]
MSSSSPSSLESTAARPTLPLVPTSWSSAAPSALAKGLSNPTSTAVPPRSPLTPSDVNVAFTATKAPTPDTLGEGPASSGDLPVAFGSLSSKAAERLALRATSSDAERKHSLQPRLEKDAETKQHLRIVSDDASASADTGRKHSGAKPASTPERPQDGPTQVRALRTPVVLLQKVVNGAVAMSSGVKGVSESDSGTAAALPLGVGRGATTEPAAAKPSAEAVSLSTADAKDAAGGNAATATPEATPPVNRRDGSGASLTPRRRYTAVAPQSSVSPLTTPSARTLSSDDDDVEGSPAASKGKGGGVAHPTVKAGADGRDLSGSQRALNAPRRTGSGSVSPTVAAARARLAAASASSTPRPSASGLAAGASADGSTDATSAEATAVMELRELRQVLKEKERDLARLERDVDKAKQSAAKAQKKSEELQGRLDSEKSAFAAHKKGTLAQKHELQRELRQAQTALRSAEQAQDKLQRDLDKQREKLATASSHTASTSATPVMTPRPVAPSLVSLDTTLQAKVSSLENEKKAMRERIGELEEQLSVAAAAVGLAKTAEEQRNTAAAAATEAAETVAALKEEVMNLRQRLASQDAALRDEREKAGSLLKGGEALEAREKAERGPAREDAAAATLQTAAASGKAETEGSSLAMRSPRKAATLETPTKEAMSHLKEELAAAQRQVGVYKRMHEFAERRIEQLQTELTAAQNRADAIEETSKEAASRSPSSSASTAETAAILRGRISKLREKLASVTAECDELRQCVRERTEEATTLQSALQQVEDERDAKVQQIHDLQSRAAKAKEKAVSALAAEKTELSAALAKAQAELLSVKVELEAALDSARVHQGVANALRSQLAEVQKQCSDLEEAKQAAQGEAEAKGCCCCCC